MERELRDALQAMVDEQCEYMRINNLGDPESQHNIKRARAVLQRAKDAEWRMLNAMFYNA